MSTRTRPDHRGIAFGDWTMNPVEAALTAELLLAALACAVAAVTPASMRRYLAGIATIAMAASGIVAGGLALSGHTGRLSVPTALPTVNLTLAPDRLGGLFIVIASAVTLLAALYAIGYVHGAADSRSAWLAFILFTFGLQMVPAAGDIITFLLAWELMALGSGVLVLTDHRTRPQARSAALWYAVMTQLSFLLILAGFAVLASVAGATTFDALVTVSPTSTTGALAFTLLILGFATKAGLVPLHIWLPRAHPEAPSHASAVMSAAMVKMGVYGTLLVVLRFMPGGPAWWGIVLLSLGGISAVYGILQASVTSDVKRLLAYSTTENIGLIFLAIGASVLLASYHLTAASQAALLAALLLAISHAAFKCSLFLGAGAIVAATGERNLDRLGGLGVRMPWTAAAFGVAALGAAALPVTSGFVAEWTLFQSFIHGATRDAISVAVALPVAVAVVALTAGLALVTFVKLYGIGFLARPRSQGADDAHEVSHPMRWAALIGAGAVIALGVFPGPVAQVLASAVGIGDVATIGFGGLSLPSLGVLLDPMALAITALVCALPVVVVSALSARRHPRRATELPWGCGGARVSPRMQYTATSYAEPLMRVFDDTLRPEQDVVVTHATESRYLVAQVRYRQKLSDVIEVRGYRPLLEFVDRLGVVSRRLQNGSVHRYLTFSFVALIVVLIVVSL